MKTPNPYHPPVCLEHEILVADTAFLNASNTFTDLSNTEIDSSWLDDGDE